MSKATDKLDQRLNRDKWKGIFVLCIAGAIAILLTIVYVPSQVKGVEVFGEVTHLTAISSEEGNVLMIVVKLADGSVARSKISNSSYYHQGERVKLLKKKSFFLGTDLYMFHSYPTATSGKESCQGDAGLR
ncbi:hypothetical protein [Photobacterium sanguinicancri]|uniref:Uncharacterized protein n=1 Tax=Photobacterium sanguinicancri TaxID=875932 RepID=A0AAW7Y6B9_9GAMM|nr:hypothetical protein [Photobacterium sanguinicancri]KXI22477.1 hypothetical protein AS132_12725 [Photobacterium sanguinicancri]MDO6542299.1 hypothetical protein [Photobacterium sanguinicancri]